MKYKSDRSIDMMNNQIIRRLNDGRRNMQEPMQKGGAKDGDGFYVSGVTSDYRNYKAPKASTGPAPSMRKGGSMKSKKY
jgi:hypothetical protein